MASITTVANTMKSYSKLYLGFLISCALLSMLSFAFLLIGIFGEHRQLIFLAGIWWSGWGSILGLTALPIGFVAEIIASGVKGSVHRYIRWVLSVFLLTGASISLLSLYIPSGKINPQTLIPLILMVIILGVLGHWKLFRVFVHLLIFVIFIVHILIIFLPIDFTNTLSGKISDACFIAVTPKRVAITYESIKKGEIIFFRKDGKPRVWYYRKEDGAFDFFDGEGHHPVYEVELKPLTREIIPLVEKQLKKEEDARQEQIERMRIKQEQSRQELMQEQHRQEQHRQEQIEKEHLEQERFKQEQLKQEQQFKQEQLRLDQLKKEQKEQLDREESSRKDLMKPGVYMIEKKLGRFGSGLKTHLHRVDILDDRIIRVTFLIENDTGSDVWIKMKEPDGYIVLVDNQGNRYNPKKPIEPHYYSQFPYDGFWITLDFEPLKRNVTSLTLQGLFYAEWRGYYYGYGECKFEYTLTPARARRL